MAAAAAAAAAAALPLPYLIPEVHTPQFQTRTPEDLQRQNLAMRYEPLLADLYRAATPLDRVVALAQLTQQYSTAFSTVHGGPAPALFPTNAGVADGKVAAIPESDRRTVDVLQLSGCRNPAACAEGRLCHVCWPVYLFSKFADLMMTGSTESSAPNVAFQAVARAKMTHIFRVGTFPAAAAPRPAASAIRRTLFDTTATNLLTHRHELRAHDTPDDQKTSQIAAFGDRLQLYPDYPIPAAAAQKLFSIVSPFGIVSPIKDHSAMPMIKTMLQSVFHFCLSFTQPYHGSKPAVAFPRATRCDLLPVSCDTPEAAVEWATRCGHLDPVNTTRCYYCSVVQTFVAASRAFLSTEEFDASTHFLQDYCRQLFHPLRPEINARKRKMVVTDAVVVAPPPAAAAAPATSAAAAASSTAGDAAEGLLTLSTREFSAIERLTRSSRPGRPTNSDALQMHRAKRIYDNVKSRAQSTFRRPAAAAAAAAAAVAASEVAASEPSTPVDSDATVSDAPDTPASVASTASSSSSVASSSYSTSEGPDSPAYQPPPPPRKRQRLTKEDSDRILMMRYRAFVLSAVEDAESAMGASRENTPEEAKKRDAFWRGVAEKAVAATPPSTLEFARSYGGLVATDTNLFTLFSPQKIRELTARQADPEDAQTALLQMRAHLGSKWFSAPSFINVASALRSSTATARLVLNAMEALAESTEEGAGVGGGGGGRLAVTEERAYQLLADSTLASKEASRAEHTNALRWLCLAACAFAYFTRCIASGSRPADAYNLIALAVGGGKGRRKHGAAAAAASSGGIAKPPTPGERTAAHVLVNAGKTVSIAKSFLFVNIDYTGTGTGACHLVDFQRVFQVAMQQHEGDVPHMHLLAMKAASRGMFESLWGANSYIMTQYNQVAPQYITLLRPKEAGVLADAPAVSTPVAAAAAAALSSASAAPDGSPSGAAGDYWPLPDWSFLT